MNRTTGVSKRALAVVAVEAAVLFDGSVRLVVRALATALAGDVLAEIGGHRGTAAEGESAYAGEGGTGAVQFIAFDTCAELSIKAPSQITSSSY